MSYFNRRSTQHRKRPRLNKEFDEACKNYSANHVQETLSKLFHATKKELLKISTGSNASSFEQTTARALLRCIQSGSFAELDRMLDRCIGKVLYESEMEMPQEELKPPVIILQPVKPVYRDYADPSKGEDICR